MVVKNPSTVDINEVISFSGGIGMKIFSRSLAAKLGCADPLSYFFISLKNTEESKYIDRYFDRIDLSHNALNITRDDAIAPLSNG